MVGWCDGAGSTSSAGASYNLDTVGQGPIALAVGAGGGCLDILTLVYPFYPLSPSLWETARYRLKYCLKGPLNPKQPTNQQLGDVSVWTGKSYETQQKANNPYKTNFDIQWNLHEWSPPNNSQLPLTASFQDLQIADLLYV